MGKEGKYGNCDVVIKLIKKLDGVSLVCGYNDYTSKDDAQQP
jgi:hypothetical protein